MLPQLRSRRLPGLDLDGEIRGVIFILVDALSITAMQQRMEVDPELTRLLHILPTGENRFTYLNIRPGQCEIVHEYIEHTWPN